MNNTVLNYLEGYFGGELNESTSDEDIMEAFNELLETADAVRDFMVDEGLLKGLKRGLKRGLKKGLKKTGRLAKTGVVAIGNALDSHPSVERVLGKDDKKREMD